MRASVPTLTLGILVGLFIGTPALFIGGYIWQAGLDLRSPSSSREWVSLCARGREDIFCKAAKHVVAREVRGPFVLIYPGVTGDRDLTAALTVWEGRFPTSQELEALVRANIFLVPDLTTGPLRALDGQRWQVTRPADQRGSYRIGPLGIVRSTTPSEPNDGAVYRSFGPPGQPTFLMPR